MAQGASEAGLPHLLVVDEDSFVRSTCGEIARGMGYSVTAARNAEDAGEAWRKRKCDVVLLDVKLSGPGRSPGAEEWKARFPGAEVVIMAASASVQAAVELMREGASDFLRKPFDLVELTATLERARDRSCSHAEIRRLRERLVGNAAGEPLVGSSALMEKLRRMASKAALANHPVMIAGEAGTGKELLARTLHEGGPASGRAWTPVDCREVRPEVLEATLFGRAASEGQEAKTGLLAAAEGGTVLLKNVDELSPEAQGRLLRALAERQVLPVGGGPAMTLTVRVLASTCRDLNEAVAERRFRRDLFYRLNVVNLKMPALRERKEDIPELAQCFLSRLARKATGPSPEQFSDDALRALAAYEWPDNVLQLETAVQTAFTRASGLEIALRDLPAPIQEFAGHQELRKSPEDRVPLPTIAEVHRQTILETLRMVGGDKMQAAKLLGIGKTTLYRKLKEYGVAT